MIAALFLIGTAAAELPKEPGRTAPIPGECVSAHALQEGDDFPSAIVDGTVVACSGVVVPTSRLGSLMIWEDHAKLVRSLYAVDMAQMDDSLNAANARIAELEKPVPWMARPTTQRWIGVAGGIIVGSASTIVAIQLREK